MAWDSSHQPVHGNLSAILAALSPGVRGGVMASRNGVHSNTERPALALVEPQATASGLVLANELSATAAQQLCHGDEHSIRQILVNVLTNAIKFTSTRDGHAGHIPVSAGAANQPPPEAALDGPGPWVYVRVEDTGCGIPADQLEAIFDAFVQVDADHMSESRGAGLGLAISRRLARLMGGDLAAQSTPGVGSTFLLWLGAAH